MAIAVVDSDILKTMMKGTRKKNSSQRYGTMITRRLVTACKARESAEGTAVSRAPAAMETAASVIDCPYRVNTTPASGWKDIQARSFQVSGSSVRRELFSALALTT
jgi:hypothetical protein